MYTYVYTHIHSYTYIHMDTHIYTHTDTNIYTYMNTHTLWSRHPQCYRLPVPVLSTKVLHKCWNYVMHL